jgi:uncharacterized repeat protein (TIGR02543 family)
LISSIVNGWVENMSFALYIPYWIPRFSTELYMHSSKILKPRSARFGAVLPILLAFVAFAGACSQPYQVSRHAVGVNLGPLMSGIASRSLENIVSITAKITDSDKAVVTQKTWTSVSASTPLEIMLEPEEPYTLDLTIVRTEGDGQKTYYFQKDFTIPESGELNLDLYFPSVADWNNFQKAMAELGRVLGWDGTPGPLSEAFAAAGASSGANGSGGGSSGKVAWSWTKTESITQVSTKFIEDVKLGETGYTILKDSTQTFSSSATQACQAKWKFSGGAVNSLEAEYTGSSTKTTFSKVLVNGFDYKDQLSIIVGSGLDEAAISAFMEKEFSRLTALMWNQTILTDMNISMNADKAAPSGSGRTGNFSWSWSRDSGSGTVSQTVTCETSTPLASPSTYSLLPKSTFTFGTSPSSMSMAVDYQLSGGFVTHFQLSQVGTNGRYGLSDVSQFKINDKDLAPMALISITFVLNDGQADFVGRQFRDQPFPTLSGRSGYTFGGWYTDSALTVKAPEKISGPTTVYAKWIQIPPIVSLPMENDPTTITNRGSAGVNWDGSAIGIAYDSGNKAEGYYAAKFDGVDTYIQFDSAPSLPASFTIALWVYPGTNSDSVIFSNQQDPGTTGITIGFDTVGGIGIQINDGSTTGKKYSAPVTTSAWHHIAVTRDGDGNLALYVDQAPILGAMAMLSYNSGGPFCLGANTEPTNHPNKFNGLIDDFRIYDYAMSAGEIDALVP